MKLTIIREDKTVYKDGKSFSSLDLSSVPDNVHALQFNDVVNKGWIEFADDDYGMKQPNELIDTLPSWALDSLQKWEDAKAADSSTEGATSSVKPEQEQGTA